MKIFAYNALIGDSLEMQHNMIVEFEGGKIISVTTGEQADCDLIIEKESTLMSGLIDCHTHLALDARLDGHLQMTNDCEAKQTIRALNSLKSNLEMGITTLRSLGDRYYIDVLLRDMINSGSLTAPRLSVAGIGMKSQHGHGYVGKGFSGSEEFRRQSRENLYHNVDWLKIFVTGGAPPTGALVPSFLTREEIHTVVDEAHSVGKKVGAHCIGGKALQLCCQEGVDVLEHCYWVDENDINAIKESNTTVCFTPGIFMDDSRLPMCPPSHVQRVKATREMVKERLSSLISASPQFVIGSDAYHGLLYKEIEYMVELGLSRIEALKGVTVYAGRLLEMPIGTIAVGAFSDLIAVKGNPLTDKESLSNVSFVMANDKIIKTK